MAGCAPAGRGGAPWLTGGAALLACLVVVYATPRDAFWIADCGNKALLAKRLLDTRYTALHLEYPGASRNRMEA